MEAGDGEGAIDAGLKGTPFKLHMRSEIRVIRATSELIFGG
jgi:hypothetical protein